MAWLGGFTAFVWAVGKLWNLVFWVRDGRPILTKNERLFADILRAKGYTETAARRTVIAQRFNESAAQIEEIQDTADLICNPDREVELREILSELATQNSGIKPPSTP